MITWIVSQCTLVGIVDWMCRVAVDTGAGINQGHEAVKARVGNAALGWFREVGLEIRRAGMLGREFRAAELAEFADEHGIDIPKRGIKPAQAVGRLGAKAYRDGDTVQIDEIKVIRRTWQEERPGKGDTRAVKGYTFNA